MATLQASDIVFYYTKTGSAIANTLSLGSTISTNTIPDNTANNIFDDVTGDQSATGVVEYRCIACKDTHASAQMLNTKVYISGYVRAASNFDTMSFTLQAPSGGTACTTIANETSAPSAAAMTVPVGGTVAWTAEGSPSSTLKYGTIPAGGWMGIWLMRSVPANAVAFSNRALTITVVCETTGSPRHAVVKEFGICVDTLFKKGIDGAIALF